MLQAATLDCGVTFASVRHIIITVNTLDAHVHSFM